MYDRPVHRVLGGRFELLALLGEGGMGAVWRARDRELDELVALKLIRPELAADGAMVARFRSEVKLARRVTHRHVARIFEVGTLDGEAYFTMELVEGPSLAQRLRAGRRPWRDAVEVAHALALALEAAHAAGVIHRDVKPDNVLLEDGGRVVLTDFGIAAARASAGGGLAGTPAYMAPEQLAGDPPTAAVDVYALGVVLHEMLTGLPAWRGHLAELLAAKQACEALEVGLPEIDPALADVVRRATARDPARRIRSASELRGLLTRWIDPEAAAVRPPRRRDCASVRDVVVSPLAPGPELEAGGVAFLGEALYEQLVARLWHVPGLRVVASWQAGARPRPAAEAAITVDDAITVSARDGAGAELVRVRVPPVASLLAATAATVASGLAAGLGIVEDEPSAALPEEAAARYLRARHLARRMGSRSVAQAVAGYDAALALAPGDTRVLAARAMALARMVFFARPDHEALAAAAAAAAAALARAPERAESQIAAGQVALHQGDPVAAAAHLRQAIARAPYAAEAHEWLGRILLEAGHVEEGIARVETALSLDPRLELAQWEIARAYALEGDWARHDAIASALIGDSRLRATPWAARFASWRGDHARALEILANADPREGESGFPPEFLARVGRGFTGGWAGERDALLAYTANRPASLRRAAMVCQLVAECAGAAGDVATCVVALERAIASGFFDLHWLDRCPLLAAPRAAGALAALRPPVAARSQRILDALYGESPSHNATADTVFATPTATPTTG